MAKRGPKPGEPPADKPGTALVNQQGRITSKRILQKWTEASLEASELGRSLPPMVYLPPMIAGKRPVVIGDGVLATAPTIKENIVRIHDCLDPIGMLMAAASGLPMVAWIVNRDGTVEEIMEVLALKERIKIAQWLADRVAPRLRAGVVMHQTKPKDGEDEWEAKLQTAATNAK